MIYSGLWSNNLRDTRATLEDIYGACVRAGPACALYENSTEAVGARVDAVLKSLKDAPMVYYRPPSDEPPPGSPGHDLQAHHTPAAYDVITYDMLKSLIFGTLYVPHAAGKFLLEVIAKLEVGDIDAALTWVLSSKRVIDMLLRCDCSSAALPPIRGGEVSYGIMGSDANVTDTDVDSVRQVLEEIDKSSEFGELWWMHIAISWAHFSLSHYIAKHTRQDLESSRERTVLGYVGAIKLGRQLPDSAIQAHSRQTRVIRYCLSETSLIQ